MTISSPSPEFLSSKNPPLPSGEQDPSSFGERQRQISRALRRLGQINFGYLTLESVLCLTAPSHCQVATASVNHTFQIIDLDFRHLEQFTSKDSALHLPQTLIRSYKKISYPERLFRSPRLPPQTLPSPIHLCTSILGRFCSHSTNPRHRQYGCSHSQDRICIWPRWP
jgi:hypothetical protein